MTQTRLSLLAAAAVALAVIVTGAANAQPGPPPGSPGFGPGQGPGMGGPAAQVPAGRPQLTDEQRTKIDALMKEQRDRTHAARDQVQKLQEQLRTELFADKPDEAKIKQLRGDLVKVQQEMLTARIDHQAKFSQILTPEQRKQMREARSPAARMVQRGAFGPAMGGAGVGRRGPGFGPGVGPGFGPRIRGGFRGPGMGRFRGPGLGVGGRAFRGPAGPGQGFGPRWWRWDEEAPK